MLVEVNPIRAISGVLSHNKQITGKIVLDLNKREIIRCMQHGTVYAIKDNDNKVHITSISDIDILDKSINNNIKKVQYKDIDDSGNNNKILIPNADPNNILIDNIPVESDKVEIVLLNENTIDEHNSNSEDKNNAIVQDQVSTVISQQETVSDAEKVDEIKSMESVEDKNEAVGIEGTLEPSKTDEVPTVSSNNRNKHNNYKNNKNKNKK